MLVEIESLKVFDSRDKCEKFVPKIFDYLTRETGLKSEEIFTKLRDLDPMHVGANGRPMA